MCPRKSKKIQEKKSKTFDGGTEDEVVNKDNI